MTSIELNENQAAIVYSALEGWAADQHELGDGLIEHTVNRDAGFNCHQRANEATEIMEAMKLLWPDAFEDDEVE